MNDISAVTSFCNFIVNVLKADAAFSTLHNMLFKTRNLLFCFPATILVNREYVSKPLQQTNDVIKVNLVKQQKANFRRWTKRLLTVFFPL